MTSLRENNQFEIRHLEDILESFGKATGMYTEAVDNEGQTIFVSKDSSRCDFCQVIRSQPNGEQKCQESYRIANQAATKWEEPYFFRCHAGLVIWAVPLIIRGTSLGSIMCGQVLNWELDDFFWYELKGLNPDINFEVLREKVEKLEVVSPERAQAAADTLFIMVSHLLKRNAYILEEQEAVKAQQQTLRHELEERKKHSDSEKYHYDAYLKKERELLRYIRLGDKTKANETLHSLLTDLYTGALGNKEIIRARVLELASLVSRAAVEGGANADKAMSMIQEFGEEINKIDKIEEYLFKVHQIVENYLEDIFLLADKKHLSTVKEARDYIMNNYASPITVEDVAQHLFVSYSHVCRLFRKELDCTVNDYVTRVRVEKAVELLKRPELSVQQVGKAVGFRSQSHFIKVFKTYIGVTPLIYRNSLF